MPPSSCPSNQGNLKPNPASSLSESVIRAPKRIETAKYVIHTEPRISATKLAEYAITDHSRQETITKNAKKASKAIMLPYGHVRNVIPNAFANSALSGDMLLQKAAELEAIQTDEPWYASDYKRSAEALRKIAGVSGAMDFGNGRIVTRPARGWPHVMIEGFASALTPKWYSRSHSEESPKSVP